ncbi:DUF2793 domain-containing protein [Streptomyces sp. N2-109]|uniref:DUF2793 domain-containing protein n=1 Tax=Streptomyces gossypii TaxID=2883101 RepID=A0ABT2K250_9ACTN|nr:DUF2793 domain-containing protein [Streptomyces gossypii]MCT2594233.1 DUF2793 domain-containing protein [Streptomyces gossypii]
MPANDNYGQQIPYPLLTDRPNAQSAFSNLVDAMVPMTNMRFISASVRGAVLTNPQAGMVTWIQDVGRLEVYDGAAWVAFSVGTSLWTDIPLVSGYSDVNSEDNNYQGPVQYRVVNLSGTDALMFRGGMHIDYVGGTPENNSGQLPNPSHGGGRFNASLMPASLRPAYLRTTLIATSAKNTTTSTCKLDIHPDGELTVVGLNDTKDSPPWVSLNGVVCPL